MVQKATLGQLTLDSALEVPLGTVRHMPPERIRAVPPLPTAMHIELPAQLTPNRLRVVLDVSCPQVVPLLVDMTTPSVPTTAHATVLQQLTPVKLVSAPRKGFASKVHVAPESPVW
jgi:hypothetical protein